MGEYDVGPWVEHVPGRWWYVAHVAQPPVTLAWVIEYDGRYECYVVTDSGALRGLAAHAAYADPRIARNAALDALRARGLKTPPFEPGVTSDPGPDEPPEDDGGEDGAMLSALGHSAMATRAALPPDEPEPTPAAEAPTAAPSSVGPALWWLCAHDGVGLPCCPTCDARLGADVRRALSHGRDAILAGQDHDAEVGAFVVEREHLRAEVARLTAELREARRLCDTVGCNAAIIRLDDGRRVCGAGHRSRWADAADLERLTAERDRANALLAGYQTAAREAFAAMGREVAPVPAEPVDDPTVVRVGDVRDGPHGKMHVERLFDNECMVSAVGAGDLWSVARVSSWPLVSRGVSRG